jgi:shikimate dehydrogenase
MPVNINTKMVTLLGKPLSQSYAARMQNAAYRAAGINMLYFYTEVENDHLPDVINGIRHMNFAGFAVTKQAKLKSGSYKRGRVIWLLILIPRWLPC